MPVNDDDHDELLTPREVAQWLGVRTTTVARWAREGRLAATRTPGGHRRYRRSEVRALREEGAQERDASRWIAPWGTPEDAVRLYQQGSSIRRVAEEFGVTYGTMRRVLRKHVVLRR